MKYPDGSTMFMGTVLAEEVTSGDQHVHTGAPTPSLTSNPAPTHSTPGPSNGLNITEKQIKALYAIVRREQRLTVNDQIAKWLREHFHVRRLDDISRDVATAFIRQRDPEAGRASGT